MSDTTTMRKNMVFCKSCIIPGWECRGKCKYAHSIEYVNPKVCKRLPVCNCRWREKPRRCTFIHANESKQQYADRMGFNANVYEWGGRYDKKDWINSHLCKPQFKNYTYKQMENEYEDEMEADDKKDWIDSQMYKPHFKNYTYKQMEYEYEDEMNDIHKELRKMDKYEY